jgi:hypothetical protein
MAKNYRPQARLKSHSMAVLYAAWFIRAPRTLSPLPSRLSKSIFARLALEFFFGLDKLIVVVHHDSSHTLLAIEDACLSIIYLIAWLKLRFSASVLCGLCGAALLLFQDHNHI